MDPLTFLLALLAGAALFAIWCGVVLPRGPAAPRPTSARQRAERRLIGLQARLDAAQMEIRAFDFVRQSLLLGVVLGAGLGLLLGAVVLAPIGILAGFLFTWSRLERERDQRQVRYNKLLAGACDVIRNSYSVKPSLQKALEAAAIYTQSPVKEDFGQLLIGYMQGEFESTLDAVAERRRSIVFDGVANALLRAERAGAGVTDMLNRLALTTRENVAAFEDAVIAQTTARSNVQWGTYGPWGVFAVFRTLTLAFSLTGAGGVFGGLTTFFSTPMGNLIALLAALITIGAYVYCYQLAQRGLVVRRVSGADALPEPSGAAAAGTERASAITSSGAPMRGQRPLGPAFETGGEA